jgi:hypothetical protein
VLYLAFSYAHIEFAENLKIENIFRIYETQCYEKVWQKTINTCVSDGIILFDQKVISVNKQFKETIGLNQLEGTNKGMAMTNGRRPSIQLFELGN